MGERKNRIITVTQYHEKMGKFVFPAGFEEHLKKLMPEYDKDYNILDENDKIKTVREYSKERKVSIIRQQMRCYGWSEFKKPVEWDDPRFVAEKPDPELQKKIHPIMMDWEELRLIVKNDMVVGVVMNNTLGHNLTDDEFAWFYEDKCIFPNWGYVYSSTSDNNGAGYKETDWYRYLVCLPYNHNLW